MMAFALKQHTFQAILFDLDGTLVNSIADIAATARNTMREFGPFEIEDEQVKNMVGRGVDKLIALLWQHQFARAPSASELKIATAKFVKHYQNQGAALASLYPQCQNLLADLSARQIPLAICTNKPQKIAQQVLRDLKIERFFQIILGADSTPHPKPAPDMLQKAARHLKIAPADCLMVGDSINDILAARAANMRIAALAGGYNHGDDIGSQGADMCFASLAEFYHAIGF